MSNEEMIAKLREMDMDWSRIYNEIDKCDNENPSEEYQLILKSLGKLENGINNTLKILKKL